MSALVICPNGGKCGHSKHDPSKSEYAKCLRVSKTKGSASGASVAPAQPVASLRPKGYPPVKEMAEEFYDATISPQPDGAGYDEWSAARDEWMAESLDPEIAVKWYTDEYPPENGDVGATVGSQGERKELLKSQGFDVKNSDDTAFGTKQVYCASHRRVHSSGWCTVRLYNKFPVPGDPKTQSGRTEGTREARRNGWPLYRPDDRGE